MNSENEIKLPVKQLWKQYELFSFWFEQNFMAFILKTLKNQVH